jgi:aldose 1-epimerase
VSPTSAGYLPRIVTLAAGDLTLDLVPEIGGTIASFRTARRGGFDLFRPMGEAALGARNMRDAASYPLIPYSNRMRDCTLHFGDRKFRLAPNFGSHPHSIHGNAWQRAWNTGETTVDWATLTFDHDPSGNRAAEWPFAYRAEQKFKLDADGFVLALSLTNTGGVPAPAGIGIHPFFPRAANTRLSTQAAGYWRNDDGMMPVAFEPVPPAWNFADGKLVAPLAIDNCFAGWAGHARIEWPEAGVALRLDADPVFGHAVIFVPPGKPYFCVEPVSHANDGMNRLAKGAADTGVRVLAPGEALQGAIRFAVESL